MSTKPIVPTDGRRERKKQRTADAIAAVAFDLFERDGFAAVTMDQIASAADVARATLYNHFPVKEALLDHHFQAEFDTGIDSLKASILKVVGLEDQLSHLFDAFCEWAASKRVYLPHCLDYRMKAGIHNAQGAEPSGLQQVFASLLASAQSNEEVPGEADVPLLAHYLEHLYFGAILKWLASDEPSPAAECRRMLSLFLHGSLKPMQKPKRRRS